MACRGARPKPATKGTADDGKRWPVLAAPTPPGRSTTLMHSAATAASQVDSVTVAAAAAAADKGLGISWEHCGNGILNVNGDGYLRASVDAARGVGGPHAGCDARAAGHSHARVECVCVAWGTCDTQIGSAG